MSGGVGVCLMSLNVLLLYIIFVLFLVFLNIFCLFVIAGRSMLCSANLWWGYTLLLGGFLIFCCQSKSTREQKMHGNGCVSPFSRFRSVLTNGVVA